MEDKLKFISEFEVLLGGMKLDYNWMRAAVSLLCQDIMVQRFAEKIGVEIMKKQNLHKNTERLLDDIEPKLKKKGLKILRSYSKEFRDGVIHRGISVDENKSLEILNKTKELLDLLSKVFEHDKELGDFELMFIETWDK